MAFQLKSLIASFLLLLLLQPSSLHAQESETLNNASSMKQISNRKTLLVVSGLEAKEEVFIIGGKSGKEDELRWELRAAPLGPDPLHHHGADPRKPIRTP